METLSFKGKTYVVDTGGFLLDPGQWDEDFAVALAPQLEISQGLSKKHWDVIYYIREAYERDGICPLVFQTCKANKLHLKDLQKLFPTGYLRGACKLAGITYKESCYDAGLVPIGERSTEKTPAAASPEKTYTIDAQGFLVNPDQWDEQYALLKAYEMGILKALTDKHWKIIYFIRDSFGKNGVVPTVYETCEANNLDVEELAKLFPHGYHRGAVKIAGLRVR